MHVDHGRTNKRVPHVHTMYYLVVAVFEAYLMAQNIYKYIEKSPLSRGVNLKIHFFSLCLLNKDISFNIP